MDRRRSDDPSHDARDRSRADPAVRPFELTGGALCLDFANTVDDRPTRPQELLPTYAACVSWGRQTGVLDQAQERALLHQAAAHPAAARAATSRARQAREAIFAVFSALASGQAPPAVSVAALNAALPAALARLRLRPRAGHLPFEWTWDTAGGALDRVLWPVLRSAAELLTSDDLPRLRQCAADECGWLFVDRSKNATRRWCDMRVCGNRSKVRRFYERQKAAG